MVYDFDFVGLDFRCFKIGKNIGDGRAGVAESEQFAAIV